MAKRAHGEGELKKRKDGRWELRVTVASEVGATRAPRRSFYGSTQAEAIAKYRAAVRGAHDGVLRLSSATTIGEYMPAWLDMHRSRLRPRTIDSYSLNIRRIQAALGRRRLDKLRPTEVQDFYNGLRDRGLSPQTVKQIHSTFHKALEDAMRLELVTRNVTAASTRPRVDQKEMHYYTPEQLARLFESTAGDRFHAAWVVLGTSGLRIGELLGLQWSDVDWRRGTLTVHRSLSRIRRRQTGPDDDPVVTPGHLVLGETKTAHSRRTVELTRLAIDALRAHEERQKFERNGLGDAWTDSHLIFCSEIGTPLEQSRVSRHWRKATAAARIPAYRIHDLRHTVATHLIMAGMDSLEVARILGHSSPNLVWNVYGHVAPASRRKAADVLDALLETASAGAHASTDRAT